MSKKAASPGLSVNLMRTHLCLLPDTGHSLVKRGWTLASSLPPMKPKMFGERLRLRMEQGKRYREGSRLPWCLSTKAVGRVL